MDAGRIELLRGCADDVDRIAGYVDWYVREGMVADPDGYLRLASRWLRLKAGRMRDIVDGRDVPTARTVASGDDGA